MNERIDYRARQWLLQRLPSYRTPDQLDRLEELDWDVLIVLDACRRDVLADVSDWPIDSAISPESCTPNWLKHVAAEQTFRDCHVVAANPQYEKTDVDLGCETVEPFWEESWRDDLQTTLPEPVLDRVSELVSERSGVVGHLQQPHWPYVAHLGETWKLAYDEVGPWEFRSTEIASVQGAMQRGLIDVDRARRAYRASVASVWNTLEDYLGRWVEQGHTVVVTADHGETFGSASDLFFYEHPCGCELQSLVQVPWVELHPQTAPRDTSDHIQDRLRALGYAQ